MNRLKRILFNTDCINKSRLAWIDYAKGIAIILVAYRHVLIGLERSGLGIHPYLMNANEMFFSFRMPLFFILSGIFISRSLAKRSIKEFILNKWQILLYPYLIWATLQITLQIIFARYTNAHRGLIDYAYIIIQPDAIDQMWYLFALFNVSVLYMFCKTLLKLNHTVQLLMGLTFYYLATIVRSGPGHDIMFFYLFYAIGDTISSNMLNKKKYNYYSSWRSFFILLPAFMLSQWYFLEHMNIEYTNVLLFAMVALIGCAFMINICFILQKYNKLKSMRIVGYHSLYIYVMHVLITSAIRSLFLRVFHITNVPLLLIISLSAGITFSIVLYNLALRSGLWFLFTLKNKEESSEIVPKQLLPYIQKEHLNQTENDPSYKLISHSDS